MNWWRGGITWQRERERARERALLPQTTGPIWQISGVHIHTVLRSDKNLRSDKLRADLAAVSESSVSVRAAALIRFLVNSRAALGAVYVRPLSHRICSHALRRRVCRCLNLQTTWMTIILSWECEGSSRSNLSPRLTLRNSSIMGN